MTILAAHPSCPPWCAGHLGEPGLSHMSASATAGRSTDPMYPHAVAVSLVATAGLGGVEVMVNRHAAAAAVFLSPEDAAAWVSILDGAGSAEFADAIRSTLALLDGAAA